MSLQILGLPNYLPTSCRTAIATQSANQKYSSNRLSQSLSGRSPAGQEARGLWVRDCNGGREERPWERGWKNGMRSRLVPRTAQATVRPFLFV